MRCVVGARGGRVTVILVLLLKLNIIKIKPSWSHPPLLSRRGRCVALFVERFFPLGVSSLHAVVHHGLATGAVGALAGEASDVGGRRRDVELAVEAIDGRSSGGRLQIGLCGGRVDVNVVKVVQL